MVINSSGVRWALGLALLLFFLLINKNNQVQVIKMTNDGFEPDNISIAVNSTVEFINADTVPRWPASNNHPIHSIYPEFNPKQAIQPGGSWKFKFDRSGQWKYHDHLYPHKKGLIAVTGNSSKESSKSWLDFTGKKVEAKAVNSEDFKELAQSERFDALKSMSEKQGVEETWNFVKDTFKGQNDTRGEVHDLAHLTGDLIFEYKGFAGISICDPTFAFGCYHGFLDKAFEKDLSNLQAAQKACAELGSSGPFASCIHGIGHGVASFYHTKDLESALKTCDALLQGAQFCHDGVFMEFARNAPGSFFPKDDQLYPCSKVEDQYLSSCGRNLPQQVRERFGLSFAQIVPICLSVESEDLKKSCIDALGFMSVTESRNDVNSIIRLCSLSEDPEYNLRCTKAAAGELIFQNVSNWQTRAPKVCDSLKENSSVCFEYIGQIKEDYKRQ